MGDGEAASRLQCGRQINAPAAISAAHRPSSSSVILRTIPEKFLLGQATEQLPFKTLPTNQEILQRFSSFTSFTTLRSELNNIARNLAKLAQVIFLHRSRLWQTLGSILEGRAGLGQSKQGRVGRGKYKTIRSGGFLPHRKKVISGNTAPEHFSSHAKKIEYDAEIWRYYRHLSIRTCLPSF